jgi:hypothetical protein
MLRERKSASQKGAEAEDVEGKGKLPRTGAEAVDVEGKGKRPSEGCGSGGC